MEIKGSVNLKAGDLFLFLLYHMYFNTSGVIYTVVAVLALAGGVYYLVNGNITGIFLIAICGVYFLLMPFMLYLKALRQYKNPALQETTEYTLTESELLAKHAGDEESSSLPWNQVQKVVSFGSVYIVYISAVRANILPKAAFTESPAELNAFFCKVLPRKKLKGIQHDRNL